MGRRRDIIEIRRGFTATRLVTVTGIGGVGVVGKTRVAVRADRSVARLAPDGTWLVNLSELDGPTPVAEVVSQALGIRNQALVLHGQPGREHRRALWVGAFIAGTHGGLEAAEARAGRCLGFRSRTQVAAWLTFAPR